MKKANTIKQRLDLLNKNTNDNYKIIDNPYVGYAILKNDIKVFESMDKEKFKTALGKHCFLNKLIDVWDNIRTL